MATCLLIQALLIEAFAISAYHIYIPVADPFARRITEGVVKDEYTHLNYGQEWLKANLDACREELEQANRENLPHVRRMLDQVAADAAVLQMDKEDLIEDFLIAYQEALTDIGFTTREIARHGRGCPGRLTAAHPALRRGCSVGDIRLQQPFPFHVLHVRPDRSLHQLRVGTQAGAQPRIRGVRRG